MIKPLFKIGDEVNISKDLKGKISRYYYVSEKDYEGFEGNNHQYHYEIKTEKNVYSRSESELKGIMGNVK